MGNLGKGLDCKDLKTYDKLRHGNFLIPTMRPAGAE